MSADDRRLIDDCLGGRSAAFGELVRRYQDRLYTTVYRLVGHAEDARDVVQEAFLHAYQSLDRFKGDAQFFTWLYRIAVNAAISNKRKRRVVLRLNYGRGGGEETEPADESEVGRPEAALERREKEGRVWRALGRMSPEHRAVLVLKEIDGQRYDAMAEILRLPIGTVRSRLHRARMELRELLERDGQQDE